MAQSPSDAEQLARLDAGEKRLADAQRRNLVIDVDAAWKERQGQTIELAFRGQRYIRPAQIPARTWLFMLRELFEQEPGVGLIIRIPDDKFERALEEILGKELTAALADTEISLECIREDLLWPVLRKWGLPIGMPPAEPDAAPGQEKKTEGTPGS